MLSVSEIGLVVDDPKLLVIRCIEDHQLCLFAKVAISEIFATIGDDEGLLVIVVSDRIWYPANYKAQKQYAKVKY